MDIMQNKNKRKIALWLAILAVSGMIGVFLFDFNNTLAEDNFIYENAAAGEFIVKLNKNWNSSEENISKIKNFFKKIQISLDSLNDGQSETLKNRLLVKLADVKKSDAFFKAAKEFSLIEPISPNYIYRPFFTPSDTLYPKQWNFEKIKIPQAWDEDQTAPLYGGDPGVIVAIIDTGVAYETYGAFVQAPDLAGTTFVPGYDFVENDDHPNDAVGHGTHIAGTIA